MLVSILDQVGEFCVTLEDGQLIFDQIVNALNSHNTVELDFQGVRVIVSPFLNAAIGQLFRDFTSEDLRQNLKISNLPQGVQPILSRVIENAKDYYTDPQYQDAVDAALQEDETNLLNGIGTKG